MICTRQVKAHSRVCPDHNPDLNLVVSHNEEGGPGWLTAHQASKGNLGLSLHTTVNLLHFSRERIKIVDTFDRKDVAVDKVRLGQELLLKFGLS